MSTSTAIFLAIITVALGGLFPILRVFFPRVEVIRVQRERSLERISGYTGEREV